MIVPASLVSSMSATSPGREAERVAQQQDRALPRRQVLDRRDERERDRLLGLIARVRAGGGVGQAVKQDVGERLQPYRLPAPGRLARLERRLGRVTPPPARYLG